VCCSSAPDHRRLRVRRYLDVRPCGSARASRLLTPLSDCTVAAFSRSVTNLEAGFKERVLYTDAAGSQPPPCRSGFAAQHDYLDEVARCVGPCNPISPSEYAGLKKGSKRTIYQRAVHNLVHRPVPLRQMASLAFFVKREATLHCKRQVPRVISPRSPEFNVLLGRYLQPIEHKVFAALAAARGSSTPVIAKGMTQQEKATVIVEKLARYGCCVGLDAKRFDQSIRSELLSLEHSLYTRLYRGSRGLRALLACQMSVEGMGRCPDGDIRYRGPAMRCSGDVNTSLGNCIISVVLAHCYLAERGIVGDIFCDGDDCLLFVPPASLPLLDNLSEWYLGYGLRMTVEEPAFEPEQVEFCQSRPVFDGQQWVLCRAPQKALNTDGFVPYHLSRVGALIHIRAVGLCGLSLAAGLPIFDVFYSSLVAHGRTGRWDPVALGGICYQHRLQVKAGNVAHSRPVHPDARISFWRAFGIHPDEQLVMEELIRSCDWASGCDPDQRRPMSDRDPSDHFFSYYPDRTLGVVFANHG
jgi:hypothetical protein